MATILIALATLVAATKLAGRLLERLKAAALARKVSRHAGVAHAWLMSENAALQGRRPFDAVSADGGAMDVWAAITAEQGVSRRQLYMAAATELACLRSIEAAPDAPLTVAFRQLQKRYDTLGVPVEFRHLTGTRFSFDVPAHA